MPPTPASSPPPRQKRRRIAVACAECRLKKSRCDGGRPQCSLCIANGIPCAYANNVLTSSKTVFDRIESRLAQLEADVSVLKRADKDKPDETDKSPQPQRQVPDGSHDDYTGTSPDTDTTDGICSMEFTDVPNPGYFGPSSNIQFMRNMRSALAVVVGDIQVASGPDPESARRQYMLQVSRPQSPVPQAGHSAQSARSAHSHTLPSDADAQPLLRRYFADTGLLFPYVHEATFFRDYNAFRAVRFRQARRSWVGLFYAILAMAAATSSVKTDRTDTSIHRADADVFFARAEELCLSDTLSGNGAGAGVETVQALLLISQFLQGAKRSVQTWSIHGLAVKSALQLGLHSEAFSGRLSPLDQEIRRRTWHGCVLLDRTLSMTFGRPPSIPDYYIRMSLPRHLVCPPHSNTSPALNSNPTPWSSSESSTLFFNATITLYKIMGRVLGRLYGSNLGEMSMPNSTGVNLVDLMAATLDMEHELLDWQRSLPAAISLLGVDHEALLLDTHTEIRLRIILTLRYHNLRILVHRPLLDHYLARVAVRSPLESVSQASQRSLAVLASSAECIIKLVSSVSEPASQKQHLFGAWWFSLYYTFNAALTMASVAICQHTVAGLPGSGEEPGQDASTLTSSTPLHNARRLVEQASTCLPRLDSGNRMAEKCAGLTRALCSLMSFLGGEAPTGDVALHTPSHSHSQPWDLADTSLDGLDFAALLSGMMPQDQESAPMDDVYYW